MHVRMHPRAHTNPTWALNLFFQKKINCKWGTRGEFQSLENGTRNWSCGQGNMYKMYSSASHKSTISISFWKKKTWGTRRFHLGCSDCKENTQRIRASGSAEKQSSNLVAAAVIIKGRMKMAEDRFQVGISRWQNKMAPKRNGHFLTPQNALLIAICSHLSWVDWE